MKTKKVVFALAMVLAMSQLLIGVMAAPVTMGSTSKLSNGGTGGKMRCYLVGQKEYFSKVQTGTEGTQYTGKAYYEYQYAIAQSWTITGTFNYSTTSTKKTNTATNSHDCSVTSFLNGDSVYVSASFTTSAISSAYGDVNITLNVAY